MLTLPEAAAVANELSALFGYAVKVKHAGALPDLPKVSSVFVYSTKDGVPKIVGICDVALTNYAGASLALIPVKAAKDAIAMHTVSPEILQNCREVMNVLAGLLNLPGGEHVALKEMFGPADARTPAVTALIGHPGKSANFEITLEGYGAGNLAMILSA